MIKRILLTATLLLMSYLIKAQSDCEDVNKELNLQIISKAFTNLPSDSAIQKLEKKYFSLTSLANCLFLLQVDITDSQETKLVYRRVTHIALKYIESDTLILLTGDYNIGKVTEIFNQYANNYQVRYISMGAKCCWGKVGEAVKYFNGQMECHLIDRNGSNWKKELHAQLDRYYNQRLDNMSRKERKRIKRKNNY